MKELLVICAMMLFGAALAAAKDFVVKIGKEDVKFDSNLLNREITLADKTTGSQKTALTCSFLFYGLLSEAKIDEASRISTDPQKTKAKWVQAQDRRGKASFMNTMDQYFKGENVVVAEIVKGKHHMLVVRSPEYTAAQIYLETAQGFMLDEGWASADAQLLGKLFTLIQDEEVVLK